MKFNYYTYKSETFTCNKCNWTGLGSETFSSDLSEIHTLRDVECPKCNETLHTFDLAEVVEQQQKLGTWWPLKLQVGPIGYLLPLPVFPATLFLSPIISAVGSKTKHRKTLQSLLQQI